MKQTDPDVTMRAANAHRAPASRRGTLQRVKPYAIALLVIPIMIAALFATLSVFGLLVRLFLR